MDCGLLEVLCKTLVAIAHSPQEPTDLCGVPEQDLLLGDIHAFLIIIISNAINSPGNHNMQVFHSLQYRMSCFE